MTLCLLKIDGMHSQSRWITEKQIDSAYSKIQRGVINAERVLLLLSSNEVCDSISQLKTNVIGIQDLQLKTKDSIIGNDDLMITNLKEQNKMEIKRGRRRAFWSFLKGTVLGALIIAILSII